MIELGKIQRLQVLREKSFGVYVGEPGSGDAAVLLPKKHVPQGTKTGDELDVFIYKDSEDRLIATTETPILQVGEVAVLEVKGLPAYKAFSIRCHRSRRRPRCG